MVLDLYHLKHHQLLVSELRYGLISIMMIHKPYLNINKHFKQCLIKFSINIHKRQLNSLI